MLALITGGSGSGKSAWAEGLTTALCPGEKIYWATMAPGGAEDDKRIARHRSLRAGKGFSTLERPGIPTPEEIPAGSTVLLEDLSNLLANLLFSPEPPTDPVSTVLEGLEALLPRCGHLIIVSNEIFSDGRSYDPDTTAFVTALAALNRELAQRADLVAEVVCGLPLVLKGALPPCEIPS